MFMNLILKFCLPAFIWLVPTPKTPTAEVLIVGVFHFDSPGLDMFNTRVKDILGERRQAEIRDVVKRLEAFQPTKLAVEAPYGSTAVQNRLDKFLTDNYQLTSSEIDQIALRLAKNLGLKEIHGIDFKQDMNMGVAIQYAKENGQGDLVEQTIQEFSSKIKPLIDEESLEGASVLKILSDMNAPEFERLGHGLYMTLLRIGKNDKYVGADLVAAWYERNLKIATNVIRIADAPDDRILILIGAGHAPLIRQILSQTPGFRVREAAEFLKP